MKQHHLHVHVPVVTDNTEVLARLDAQGKQLTAIQQSLKAIQAKEKTMATQDDINALSDRLGAAVSAIQQEISDLQAANPTLDLSGLQDKVAAVEGLELPPAAPA